MSTDQRGRYLSVTAGARGFALLLLAGPVAVAAGSGTDVLFLVALATIWMGAVFADGTQRIPVMPALVVEASLVTFVVGLNLEHSGLLLPALVVPAFVGGLVRGMRGAFEVLGVEVVIIAASILPNAQVVLGKELATLLFTWIMGSLGVGLLAAVINRSRSESSTISSYRDARLLISRLLDLSGDLVDGLDPVSIGQNVVDLMREELPLNAAAIYVRSAGGITPLLDAGVAVRPWPAVPALSRQMSSDKPLVEGGWVYVPLATDAGVVAVVAGALAPRANPDAHVFRSTLNDLMGKVRPMSLQLDAALLFSEVRDHATAEERRRLARDLHDGVAQDLASLGYLIDDMAATAQSAKQVEGCRDLRSELTRVVSELRRSVFLLRNETHDGSTLGETISSLADHIQSRSGIKVTVQLDETPERLRPDVEAELLRIAQEAMNNAVKHARSTQITVSCRVAPPYAEIRVADDGRGMQVGRDDSHGLRIMRERARRIGASLEISGLADRSGTEVRVEMGSASVAATFTNPLEGVTAS